MSCDLSYNIIVFLLLNINTFYILRFKIEVVAIILVFENKEKMVLVMEIAAGGELYDYLRNKTTVFKSSVL